MCFVCGSLSDFFAFSHEILDRILCTPYNYNEYIGIEITNSSDKATKNNFKQKKKN